MKMNIRGRGWCTLFNHRPGHQQFRPCMWSRQHITAQIIFYSVSVQVKRFRIATIVTNPHLWYVLALLCYLVPGKTSWATTVTNRLELSWRKSRGRGMDPNVPSIHRTETLRRALHFSIYKGPRERPGKQPALEKV